MEKETKPRPLRIVQLKVRNILGIKAAEVTPEESVIKITGKNAMGKTSLLQSICMALEGKSGWPAKPLHDGATQGETFIDLDDLIVEMKIRPGGSDLIVRAKTGDMLRTPQKILDTLWNKLCHPMRFIEMDKTPEGRKRQAVVLQKLVGLDFEPLVQERVKLYDERTVQNRLLSQKQAELISIKFDTTAPKAIVSSQALLGQLEIARTHNQAIDESKRAVEEKRKVLNLSAVCVRDLQEEIAQMEQQLSEKKMELARLTNNHNAAIVEFEKEEKRVNAVPRADEKVLTDKIANADSENAKVRNNQKYDEIIADTHSIEAKVQELNASIDGVDTKKRAMLEGAKWPVPGLSFDEDGILYEGIPFNQVNDADKLFVAAAIGLALEPRVRVVLVTNASLFDSDTIRRIEKFAEEHNCQWWLEQVLRDGDKPEPSAVVIEDGTVKG